MRHSLRFVWQDISRYLTPRFQSLINIREGTDFEGTIQAIKTSAGLKGAEFWLLVCSTVIASTGLDLNSPAIIIAGILITPIFKPIIGLGLGFGISDKDMIFSSLKHFIGIAVVIFLTSVIYFIITPLGQPTFELSLRAKPILIDVLVAIFGGVAIIVNYSRQQKSISFPRVIIGFALIPPLSTSAYGFIHADPKFYFGAIYLFFLNTFFISISIYLISRYLNFPFHQIPDKVKRLKMQKSIAAVAILLILPSSYILYDVVVQAKVDKKAQSFIKKYVNKNGYEALRWEFDKQNDKSFLKVFVVGNIIPPKKVNQLQRDFRKYFLSNYELKLIQMNFPELERSQIKKELTGEVTLNVLSQLQSAQAEKQRKQNKIDSLQKVMRELYINKSLLNDIKEEVEIVFPEVNNVRFGLLGADILDSASNDLLPVAYLEFRPKISNRSKLTISGRVRSYLQIKFKRDSVNVVFD